MISRRPVQRIKQLIRYPNELSWGSNVTNSMRRRPVPDPDLDHDRLPYPVPAAATLGSNRPLGTQVIIAES